MTAGPDPAIMAKPTCRQFPSSSNHRCSRTGKAGPLPYLRKIAMPPEPILETAGACHAVGDQGLAAVVPFLNQTLAHAKPMALDGRTTVSTNANLRKARDLLCHCLCLRACAPLRGEVFAQADRDHTSELQSRRDLVCRLLLEKKKKIYTVLGSLKKKRKMKCYKRITTPC